MARFVILEHDHPALHWDLMLETGSVLHTWRLAEPPELGKTISAKAIVDHRLMYLDYEGPISRERGNVTRWDNGIYEGDVSDEIEIGGEIIVALFGERTNARLRMRHRDLDEWTMEFQGAGRD